jgi:CheY-like chemotaxis protein
MTTSDVRAPYLVAVMGFGGFEQQALDSYLGLARHRTPAYAPCATVEDAHFVIANGDRGGALDLLAAAQRTGDTVVVGQVPVGGAAGVATTLARPIDPLHLFRALDEAVKRRSLAATAARASPRNVTMADLSTPWSNEEQRGAAFYAPPGAPLGRAGGGGAPARAPAPKPRGERPVRRWAAREADQRPSEQAGPRQKVDWPGSQLLPTDPWIPSRLGSVRRRDDRADPRERPDGLLHGRGSEPPSPGQPPDGVAIPTLALVSNEEPELSANAVAALRAPPGRMPAARPVAQRLAALVIDRDAAELAPLLAAQNLEATGVDKTHHAFAMLDAFVFDVIVIDVDLGANSELDGLEVCQTIHRQQRAPGEWCPPIVLTSAQPSALEQARGMLAGANVYLAKPVRPAALAQALILAGLRPAWTQAEAGGAEQESAGKPDPDRASR